MVNEQLQREFNRSRKVQPADTPGHDFTPGPALCPHPLDAHSSTVEGLQYCAACGSSLTVKGDSNG